MFGYIIANLTLLDENQKQRYQSCYCGLCHMIRTEFSSLSRLSLNYDMTFLVLLLSSLYEPGGNGRPIPVRRASAAPPALLAESLHPLLRGHEHYAGL